MYVVYRTESLSIDQLVYTAGPEFMAWLDNHESLSYVETDMNKGATELAVKMVGGEPTLIERQPFSFTVPTSFAIGEEKRITGIPAKTQILTDSGLSTMPSSGILDLSFKKTGEYHLTFTHPEFLSMTITIEVA